MATITMNVSMTEDLKAFIDDQMADGGFATSSEYLRALVRREREVARVNALLDEGGRSPQDPPVDQAYFDRLHQHIRERARSRA